jgi:hypothetical protein
MKGNAVVQFPEPEIIESSEGSTGFLGGLMSTGLSVLIAVISLGMSLFSWYDGRDAEWENSRPLADVRIASQTVFIDSQRSVAHVSLEIRNVGELSFVLRDLKIKVQTGPELRADWDRFSLLEKDSIVLPAGIRPFEVSDRSEQRLTVQFPTAPGAWHLVDPGRAIAIPFTIPLHGHGSLGLGTTAYLQTADLVDKEDSIRATESLAGKDFPISVEFGSDGRREGEDSISTRDVFPFSGGHILVVTPPWIGQAPLEQAPPASERMESSATRTP